MTIRERFDKYRPVGEELELACDLGTINQFNYDKTRRYAILKVSFPRIFDKENVLYNIEHNLKKIYNLSKFEIIPNYPSELFTVDYFEQILVEAKRRNLLTELIVSDKYQFDGKKIDIYINYGEGGVILANESNIDAKLANIIYEEFGIEVKINLIINNDFEYEDYFNDVEITEIKVNKTDEKIQLSYNKNYNPLTIEDNVCSTGYSQFDLTNQNLIYGEEFEKSLVPISSIEPYEFSVATIGEVFNISVDYSNSKDIKIDFILTDYEGAISCSLHGMDMDHIPSIDNGNSVIVFGNTKLSANETKLYVNSVKGVSKIKRSDNYQGKKRVELHLHTIMSQMDSVLPTKLAVETAAYWGHPAIAITDHGVAQAYPEAMRASAATGIKILYGMEGYLANDEEKILYGSSDSPLDSDVVVFDIETTGLQSYNCEIIEIGAVKIINGEVVDSFDTFVSVKEPITAETTELTSITNEDLIGAPSQYEAVKMFTEFVKDLPLVAHNANFDMGFILKVCKENNIDFPNPYIDTLSLAKFVVPNLKNYKLDTLTEHFRLGNFHHHRGIDDATITSKLYLKLIDTIKNEGILTFNGLNEAVKGKVDPLKIKTNHISILVKNKIGLKNLYKLISDGYVKYYYRSPRIPKSTISNYREGLIFGSACSDGELYRGIIQGKNWDALLEIANFYDYLEIMPVSNNRYLNMTDDELREINKKIIKIGEETGKIVVATGDVHYLNRNDKILRTIIQDKQGYKDLDLDCELYFRTTEEMLEEFSYLGEELAYKVVVENTNIIADMVESGIKPYPDGTFTPEMEGAKEDLENICYQQARDIYGDELPEIVSTRLGKEIKAINDNGFSVLYMIARKLVKYSESQGYLVGSRGSVGSSIVAFFGGISEVNPLPAHYVCPKCKHSDFTVMYDYGSGYDLPEKNCPECGTPYNRDGHDIPFETFLGFKGDKSPDIDLNFSGLVQNRVHKYTEELFGAENVFHAGTVVDVAERTAELYVKDYMKKLNVNLGEAMTTVLSNRITGVKRTTGQHPGGIVVVPKKYEVYDFCPVQIPPVTKNEQKIITTHFTFNDMHDLLLKLDELGHDVPTKMKYLEMFSGINMKTIPMSDPEVYKLFTSTAPLGVKASDIYVDIGTLGIPESGTSFVIGVMKQSNPKNFSDLIQISGATHGTDVWNGNADQLIKNGTCTLSTIVGTRDSIMLALIRYGLDNKTAFDIMEMVRKNKKGAPLKQEHVKAMKDHNVPDWYIESLSKIKYMFPKAHAAAYVTSAIKLAWFKVHKPLEFYCAYFSAVLDGFDADLAVKGCQAIKAKIDEIDNASKNRKKTVNEKNAKTALLLTNEMIKRGIKVLPIHLYKSHERLFLPENGCVRLPFESVSGVGQSAALSIVKARKDGPFFSIEDLKLRTGLGKTAIEALKKFGALKGLPETDQISLDFGDYDFNNSESDYSKYEYEYDVENVYSNVSFDTNEEDNSFENDVEDEITEQTSFFD